MAAVAALAGLGLAMIYSATYDPTSGRVGSEFGRQVAALAIGLAAGAACLAIDYRTLADQWRFAFGALSVLLAYTLLFGDEVGGGRRWIDLGPTSVQPSEFAAPRWPWPSQPCTRGAPGGRARRATGSAAERSWPCRSCSSPGNRISARP